MTPREIELIRNSFAKVRPAATFVAQMFYARLFRLAPEVKALFGADMQAQRESLMAALEEVVLRLEDFDALLPLVKGLAHRHVGFGVEAAHYEPVGDALIWALGQALGPAFDEETKAAWRVAYGAMSSAMIASAYPGAPGVAAE